MPDANISEICKARKCLELGDKVTIEEIKKAYRRLSKLWHPDKCGNKNSEICHEKMKEINKAYKIILKYIESYRYDLADKKINEDDPMVRWQEQFGDDPMWGSGMGWL